MKTPLACLALLIALTGCAIHEEKKLLASAETAYVSCLERADTLQECEKEKALVDYYGDKVNARMAAFAAIQAAQPAQQPQQVYQMPVQDTMRLRTSCTTFGNTTNCY